LNHAKEFERAFISVNVLRAKNRQSDIMAKKWILDSGAFTEIAKYGEFRTSVEQYAAEIKRWSQFQNFELAVTQDYMCEPFMVARTGLSVEEHQRLTIERYDKLVAIVGAGIVMPVLQGYKPTEYQHHVEMYGERLTLGMRVGVGSVCKRNTNPTAIIAVLEAITSIRPDLKLHGFGLKITALQNAYIASLLYSADSMAWSYAARRQHKNQNGLNEAQHFVAEIRRTIASKAQQLQLANLEPKGLIGLPMSGVSAEYSMTGQCPEPALRATGDRKIPSLYK